LEGDLFALSVLNELDFCAITQESDKLLIDNILKIASCNSSLLDILDILETLIMFYIEASMRVGECLVEKENVNLSSEAINVFEIL
jgi:hypothetical protein